MYACIAMRGLYLVFSINLLLVLGQNAEYKGHKVYNVKLQSEEQQNQLHILRNDGVDFWRNPSARLGIVGQAMVSPSHLDWFEERLQALGVGKEIAIEDVYSFIADSNENDIYALSKNTTGDFDFAGYYSYSEILNHISRLNETYFNSTTVSFEVVEAGNTEENRPLIYIKLTGNVTITQKPVVVVEGGIIPREWVTIPSALYVLDNLLVNNNIALLDEFEWIIIPVVNPDGYEYTRNNLRFWMKNRSTRSHLGHICPGANINRNFDIDWSISDSSSSPCSHLYAGVNPLSEEETQLINNILDIYGNRIQLYLSLQNTGGFISYPWQFERAASGLFRQHFLLSQDMVAAMNATYQAGIGAVVSGLRASGTSVDYAREKGVLFTFNVDIIPVGEAGVVVPANEIVNVAEDVWRAVSVAARNMSRHR